MRTNRSTSQTPGPESVARDVPRLTTAPSVRTALRRRPLARPSSPSAPPGAQPTLQESAPFHGATPYPPNRVTPNTRARMMTKVSAVNTARLSQLNQTTGRDG